MKTFLVDNDDPNFRDKINQPGAMWYCPWYYAPGEPEIEIPPFISVHYRNDWSGKRPPIAVRCPNGRVWVVDQVSSNGSGWVVTGEAPNITCRPSIAVPGYHGWLTDGVFSESIG